MKKIIILTCVLSSCAYGPAQEKKSPLNYLNGEHYDQSVNINSLPVLGKQKEKDTIISGKLEMDDAFSRLPNKVELALVSNGKTILTSHTNAAGIFSFQGNLINGKYLLKASSSQFSGEKLIDVDAYKVDVLVVMKKAN